MSQWRRALEERIASCEAKIAQQFKRDERCARLAKVPGVVPLDVTALVAAVGNAQEFKNGRELSAFLGWFRASIPRAASECCSGLPNAAIVICARCAGENCAVLTRIWTLTTINTPARIEISRRRFSFLPSTRDRLAEFRFRDQPGRRNSAESRFVQRWIGRVRLAGRRVAR